MKLIAKDKANGKYLADLSKITKGAAITLSGAIGGKSLLFLYIDLNRFM